MEYRVLTFDELKLTRDLCVSGENWADVYYDKIKLARTDKAKNFALFVDEKPVSEITALEDDIYYINTVASAYEVVELIDHKALRRYHGKGYGTAILDYVCYYYKDLGYKMAALWIADSNKQLNEYYKRHGFVSTFVDQNDRAIMIRTLN